MTPLAIALAYLGTLAFVAFWQWFSRWSTTNLRDDWVKMSQIVRALHHRAQEWDKAANFVEAEQLKRGLTRK